MDDIARAKELLYEALDWMKNGWGGFSVTTEMLQSLTSNEGRMLKEDRDACWEQWLEAKQRIEVQKESLWTVDFSRLSDEASAVCSEARGGDPYEALRLVKQIQSELKLTQMRGSQRQVVKDLLNTAWDLAIARIDASREEKRRKREEWLSRCEDNIQRWTDLIHKNEGIISRLEGQISDLESQISGSSSESFADRARGWIEEKYQKISDIGASNTELERKISDVKSRMTS